MRKDHVKTVLFATLLGQFSFFAKLYYCCSFMLSSSLLLFVLETLQDFPPVITKLI